LEKKVFALSSRDQQELWSFLAPLLGDDDLATMWTFASDDSADRGALAKALRDDANRRGLTLTLPPRPGVGS
jgi:hypothetical protein